MESLLDISKAEKKNKLYDSITHNRFRRTIIKDWQLYVLCAPVIIYFLIFEFGPMYGVQLAFKDFIIGKGIWGSPWVGFKHFERFFTSYQFNIILRNTLVLSIYSLAAGFPFPVILAIMLNNIRGERFKKIVQTTTYAPHFISVVVFCGMINIFLSPSTGIVNFFIKQLRLEPIFFMGKASMFSHIFVWSDIWQNTGWAAIVYVAALSGINPELYEAAKIDGANKLKSIWHVDLPGIMPTIITLLIMRIGKVLSLGFQKAYLLQTPLNIDASEIIATYTYKVGLLDAQYSYSTAIGLFNTVVNILLLIMANQLSKKFNDVSLW